MTWPQATDYNAAVQSPALCFSDPDLRQGTVVGDVLGLPRPHSGNFADVYQVNTATGSWAVKCFTRPVDGLHQRYQAICEHLRTRPLPFMVDFVHLEEGIRVRGQWFPVLKMRWIEGLRLNEFIAGCIDKPAVLDRLAQMWVRLAHELREAGMAHGDLQHGNVLLVPGSKVASLALKLIDYDGLFVPALEDQPSGEVGHPNYQHGQRLSRGTYNVEMDRFAHLVICTALRCLRAGGAALWLRHDSGENLLFREEDFRTPGRSRLWPELFALRDPEARALAGHLLLASQGPLLAVPVLEDLWVDGGVRMLTPSELAQARALVGTEVRQRRKARAPVVVEEIPPLPCPLAETVLPVAVPVAVAGVAETLPELLRNATVVAAPVPPPLPPTMPPPLPSAAVPPPLPPALPSVNGASPHPALPTTTLWQQLTAAWRQTRLRPLVAVGVVGGALLLLALIVAAARRSPAPAPRSRPQFAPLTAVDVVAGDERDLTLSVHRNGFMGPLTLEIDNVPEWTRISGNQPLAPWDDLWHLRLLIHADSAIGEHSVRLRLRADGQVVDEQSLLLQVAEPLLPTLGEPLLVRMQAGETRTVPVPVDRHAVPGSLSLVVDDPPPGITATAIPSNDAEPQASLRITAATDAAPRTHLLHLTLKADARRAMEGTLCLTIDAAAVEKRMTLAAQGPVEVMAGGGVAVLDVTAVRKELKGEIKIEATDLPEGVTAPPSVIAETEERGVLSFRATADAVEGKYKILLRAKSAGEQVDSRVLVLLVTRRLQLPGPADMRKPNESHVLSIRTADGVFLRATLYSGSLGKAGACVLLLPELGPGRDRSSLVPLAKALQGDGHTVLLLDFRGHGDSTLVDPVTFWGVRRNQLLRKKVGEGVGVASLSSAAFPVGYYPWLVQDLIAARDYLDGLSDDPRSSVNRSNLVVIGAEEAAALGCLWLASECHRFASVGPMGPGGGMELAPEPEAKSVAGAIWLTVAPTFGWPKTKVEEWLVPAARYQPVPMVFVFGAKDAAGSATSRRLLAATKGTSKVHSLTTEEGIPATASSGVRLLDADQEGIAAVQRHVKAFLKAGPRPTTTAIYRATNYFWSFAGGKVSIPAKIIGAATPQPFPVDQIGLRFDRSRPGE